MRVVIEVLSTVLVAVVAVGTAWTRGVVTVPIRPRVRLFVLAGTVVSRGKVLGGRIPRGLGVRGVAVGGGIGTDEVSIKLLGGSKGDGRVRSWGHGGEGVCGDVEKGKGED